MDSKVVNREIRRVVRPLLREVGFSDFPPRSSWRHWEEGIDVINFQSFNSYLADGAGSTTFSYAVRLGILLHYLPHGSHVNMQRPDEAACDLRPRMHKGLSQPFFHPYGRDQQSDRPDVWYVLADGSNLELRRIEAVYCSGHRGKPVAAISNVRCQMGKVGTLVLRGRLVHD